MPLSLSSLWQIKSRNFTYSLDSNVCSVRSISAADIFETTLFFACYLLSAFRCFEGFSIEFSLRLSPSSSLTIVLRIL